MPTGLAELADVGFSSRMKLAETGKILHFEEVVGTLLHQFQIKMAVNIPCILPVERQLLGVDVIAVCPADGVEAGVGIGADLHQVEKHDVGRQKVVQGIEEGRFFLKRDRFPDVEVGVVVPGIDAGVGASAAGEFYGFGELQTQALFQFSLYAVGIVLTLPAVIGGAVVSQMCKIAGQDVDFVAKIGIVGGWWLVNGEW